MTKRKNPPSAKIKDVLADAAAKAGLSDSALHAVRTWLAGQMEANQFARLTEGGHAQNQIPLRQVFVDLPVRGTRSDGDFLVRWMKVQPLPLAEFATRLYEAEDIKTRQRLPALLLTDGTAAFDESEIDTGLNNTNPWQAVLLIGGPGQGKSTLGQLACQLHRASLLQPVAAQLSLQQQEVLRLFTKSDATQELAPPL